jgi:hypothetical protein
VYVTVPVPPPPGPKGSVPEPELLPQLEIKIPDVNKNKAKIICFIFSPFEFN